MDVRHPQYLGTEPMNQLTEVTRAQGGEWALQFNCDQCNKTNSSDRGLTQYMWMKQNPSKKFRHYNFDNCSQDCKKKRPEGQEKV